MALNFPLDIYVAPKNLNIPIPMETVREEVTQE